MIDCNTSLSITSKSCLRAIARYVAQYQAHYADRLIAVYVFGSVHRGEANACASDLDLILVTTDGFGQQDQEWELARWQEQERVQKADGISSLSVGLTRASSLEQVLRGLQPGAEQQCAYLWIRLLCLPRRTRPCGRDALPALCATTRLWFSGAILYKVLCRL